MDRSIVQFLGNRSAHDCGYCKGQDCSLSDGMWAHTLTVQDYQDLIDRGWRRSGLYCYKPKMDETCCPCYTIKCSALDFQPTKSQKKILKRMRKFLIDGKKEKSQSMECLQVEEERCSEKAWLDAVDRVSPIDMKMVEQSTIDSADGCSTSALSFVPPNTDASPARDLSVTDGIGDQDDHKKDVKMQEGTDISADCESKPKMRKAKLIRLERREKKMAAALAAGQNPVPAKVKQNSQPKTIEDFINEPLPPGAKHHLEIRLMRAEMPELGRSEWPLYSKYQMAIHHDKSEDCDLDSFQEFLLSSPLKYKNEGDGLVLGSFHQQYWLDGTNLIAVGVLDILPSCVSSVYFFYDPDFSFLSLGTYSTLREIELTRRIHSKCKTLKFYYMGFYIHSCPKMKYKGKMSPSFLLCPETYLWLPIQPCLPKLDKSKYSRLHDKPREDNERDPASDLNKVLVLWKHTPLDFGRYKRLCKKVANTEEVKLYANLVGRPLAQRMLLVCT